MENRPMQIRRILAPTDFSEPSKQAIAYAFELAQTFGATLILLHVIEELPPYIGFLPPEETPKALEELAGRARRDLAQVVPQAQDGQVEVTCQAVVGAPYPKIIEVAQEMNADMIVIATHGRTGFRHFVMGSVAEHVVRTAPCPVLTIRSTVATEVLPA
jgi:nucleotide-binding universal stress UspA family protein